MIGGESITRRSYEHPKDPQPSAIPETRPLKGLDVLRRLGRPRPLFVKPRVCLDYP